MQPTIAKCLQGWRLVGTLSLAILLLAVTTVVWHQGSVEGIRLALRTTARTSLLLFCLAFVASALYRLWSSDGTCWLRQNRRYLGVSFAASHGMHAVLIASFALLDPESFLEGRTTTSFALGGLAYAFIIAMAATSFDSTAAWVGRRAWRILHTVGAWYIWVSFLSATSKKAVVDPFYWPFVAVLVTVVAVRILARYLAKRVERPAVRREAAG